jgi:hypothetical protein
MGTIISRSNTNKRKNIDFFIASPEYATQLLKAAENTDKYGLKSSIGINSIARKGMRYDVIPGDITYSTTSHDIIPHWLLRNIPAIPIPIIILHPSADGGMPHTRGGAICCPGGNGINNSKTLLHEVIHIHQRANPSKWASFYKHVLDFTIWLGTIPDELEKRRRLNPDTVEIPYWIWRNRWIPVPVLIGSQTLTSMRVYFYDVMLDEWSSATPREWIEFFGTDLPESHKEHPHEMAAYWLSDDTATTPASAPAPARTKFNEGIRKWFIDN